MQRVRLLLKRQARTRFARLTCADLEDDRRYEVQRDEGERHLILAEGAAADGPPGADEGLRRLDRFSGALNRLRADTEESIRIIDHASKRLGAIEAAWQATPARGRLNRRSLTHFADRSRFLVMCRETFSSD